ncbi:hypothetical protein HUW46_02106 [Amycolatopsis sp. CA-230715]|nr:hypothetical protein HUW46_02106 [Amycolatopsis sp. CA-230715]
MRDRVSYRSTKSSRCAGQGIEQLRIASRPAGPASRNLRINQEWVIHNQPHISKIHTSASISPRATSCYVYRMSDSPVAWLALFLSAISLLWQIISWRHSGPRIQVQLEKVRPRNTFEGAYAIIVSNNGRQAATIPEVRLRWQKKTRDYSYNYFNHVTWGVDIDDARSDSLPATLSPGGSIIVYASHDEIAAEMSTHKVEFRHLIPLARVGTRWIEGELNGIRDPNRSELPPL